jgi:hypothetical protein
MRRSYLKALSVMLRDSPSDIIDFAKDIAKSLFHPSRLHGELIAWHHTVQVWQNPEHLAALLEPHDEADYVEVSSPSLSQVK